MTPSTRSSSLRAGPSGWLFSPRADLGMLALPALVTAAAVLWSVRVGRPFDAGDASAVWIAHFVLGNSNHVVLTFLLLGARPDLLFAQRRQAPTVVAGSIATFALGAGAFAVFHRHFYVWSDLLLAIVMVFAVHHTLSQVKGLWSLYNLRGKALGVPPPGEPERRVQRIFVPLGLVLVTVRILFVPKSARAEYPFIQAIPQMAAPLPFEVTYLLLAAWIVFVAALFRALRGGPRPESHPKLLYLGTHAAIVAITVAFPAIGTTFSAGVHGLEYSLLSARMLHPTAAEPRARLGAPLVWPALLAAMSPVLLVGLVNAPFTPLLGLAAHARLFPIARFVLNGVVLAHYFADAFIYRFRIPEVRQVALRRLGFDPGHPSKPVHGQRKEIPAGVVRVEIGAATCSPHSRP
jgi:hypothetical protein